MHSPALNIAQPVFKKKNFLCVFQYENPWTIPNLLCVCRIALAPVLGILITEQHFHLSLGLFALAGFTDVVHTPAYTHSLKYTL